MTFDKTEVQLMTSPLRSLRQGVSDLMKYIFINRFFRYSSYSFSWVSGLSEVEINDFSKQYGDTKQDIKNIISVMENKKLKDKLNNEYDLLPTLDTNEFIISKDNNWFLKSFRPLKTFRKSIKFKDLLEDIDRTSERMINYIENAEWLELEPTTET